MASVMRLAVVATERKWQSLPILDNGRCEPLKAAIHGLALGLAALMGAYNAAAWLRRRQHHLAINAVIYATAVAWECGHVRHHVAPCVSAVSADGDPPPTALAFDQRAA